MPDIAMCKNENCKIKERCIRYMAKPDPQYQSYVCINKKVDKPSDCELYDEYYPYYK